MAGLSLLKLLSLGEGEGSSSIYLTADGYSAPYAAPGIGLPPDENIWPRANKLYVTSSGSGVTGSGGSGSGTLGVSSTGVGLTGNLSASADSYINVTSDGDGAWGGIGTPEASASVYVKADATTSLTTFLGSGTSSIYLTSTGTGYVDAITGSGASRIYVTSHESTVNVTVASANPDVWTVYSFTIPISAVSRHSTPHSEHCVVGKSAYALNSGSVMKTGERTDNGTAISSIIGKSGISPGGGSIARATDLYIRLMSEGNFTVDVVSDNGNGQVSVADNVQRKHGCKTDLPRGVYGQEFGFTVQNAAGAYFEIDKLDFIMALSNHRRGRQTNG